MKTYVLSVWLGCLTLESVILMRALGIGWFRKYRVFFTYIAWVLFQDLCFLAIYFNASRYYARIYWFAEFITLVLGCGLTWEIFQRALRRCPGARRMANGVLAFVLMTALSKVAVNTWDGITPWSGTMIELERNLRAVQATSLIALVFLLVYYGIPLGRNLMGILFGYGLFISTSVLNLTLRAFFGPSFQGTWVYLQPLCYSAVLAIWCTSLWNYQEAPIPQTQPPIEADYEQLVRVTKAGFLQVRDYVGKGLRS